MSKDMFSQLKLRTKLALLLALSTLALIASVGCGALMLRDRMTEDRIDKLRAVVQSTMAIAQGLETQVVAKTLTREQAIAKLRESIHLLRYDAGAGYVTVSSAIDGTGIINGSDPAKEGTIGTARDEK